MIYVLSGNMELSFRDDDYILRPGDTAVIFPNLVHEVISPVPTWIYLTLFYPNILPDFFPNFHNFYPVCPIIYRENASASFTNSIFSFYEFLVTAAGIRYPSQGYCHSFSDSGDLLFAKGYLQIILSHVFQNITLTSNHPFPQEDRFLECIRFVTENYQDPITLADVGHALGISSIQVSRIFSQKIGHSFSDYLRSLRLNHAYTLLRNTDMSIIDICNDSGFGSLSTFYSSFQKEYGITPKRLRGQIP